MKTLIRLVIIISLSVLFTNIIIAKIIFKGIVEKKNKDAKIVWIKTNQAQYIKEGAVLYIHDRDDSTKAILKVSKIIPRYLKGEIIDGSIDNIKLGDKVNNIYQWDGYSYYAEIIYEKDNRQVTIKKNIILDKNITYIPFEETDTETLDTRDINSIKVIKFRDSLIATEINLNDYTSIKLNDSSLNRSLNLLSGKKLSVNTPGFGITKLNDNNIRSIKLIKRLKGKLRLAKLHHSLGESAQPQFEENGYSVTFRFINLELGRYTLENMIANETDPEKLSVLIDNLKLYDNSKVTRVSVVGSFNNWDASKHPMTKDNNGIYSVKVPLSQGVYKYYFILSFLGTSNIELKVLDPYSNKIISNNEEYVAENIINNDVSDKTINKENKITKIKKVDNQNTQKTNTVKKLISADKSIGVSGKVSVIEVPGIFTKLTTTKKIDKKKNTVPFDDSIDADKIDKDKINGKKKDISEKKTTKALPYDPNELKVEEKELASNIDSSISVGKISYYKVDFKFDQLSMIRVEVKKAINEETAKDTPDEDKLNKYKKFLASYSESNVDKVSVIIESSESKQVNEYTLTKQNDGSWIGNTLLEKGKYTYKYSISLGKDAESYIMSDSASANKEINNLNQEVSVLYIGIPPTGNIEKNDTVDTEKDNIKEKNTIEYGEPKTPIINNKDNTK